MGRLYKGQERAEIRRKRPDPINQPSNLSQKIPGRTEIETEKNKPSAFQGSDPVHKQYKEDDKQ